MFKVKTRKGALNRKGKCVFQTQKDDSSSVGMSFGIGHFEEDKCESKMKKGHLNK